MQSHTTDSSTVRRTLRAWQAFAGALFLVFAWVLVYARHLSYSDATGPGPGFFPVWIGVLGVGASLALLAMLRAHAVRSFEPWTWPGRGPALRIVVTVAAVALASLGLDRLGFRATMILFLAVLLRCFGVQSWLRIAIVATLLSLVVHYAFDHLLKVRLPVGVLGF